MQAVPYYQKSEKERMELFKKLESYLTYLDVASLEAKGADVESKKVGIIGRVGRISS